MQRTFNDIHALKSHIQQEGKGALLITYRNCVEYEGMVLGIMLVFDTQKAEYKMDLQWMSFGLDPYGDTLQESYVYQFDSLEKLLAYLKETYSIGVTDIPIKYSFDPKGYPDPITDEAKRPLFEAAWNQFQLDFGKGKFLDPSKKPVYVSDESRAP